MKIPYSSLKPGQWIACDDPKEVEIVYDVTEQDIVLDTFTAMLRQVTQDGGRKRAAGTKPPWYVDNSHEAAVFSHLNRWKHGEKVDPDSGVHPLVHLAWRALAIAAIESGNIPK